MECLKKKCERVCPDNYVFCYGPKGKDGKDGNADTITVGTTQTGPEAAVIDRTGSPNHVLDFIIPDPKTYWGCSFNKGTKTNYLANEAFAYGKSINKQVSNIRLGSNNSPQILNGTDGTEFQYYICVEAQINGCTTKPIFNMQVKNGEQILSTKSVQGIPSPENGTYFLRSSMMVSGDIVSIQDTWITLEISSSQANNLVYTNMYIIPIANSSWQPTPS